MDRHATEKPLSLPLPRFRQPISDPPLPAETDGQPASSPAGSPAPGSPSTGSQPAETPAVGDVPPPPLRDPSPAAPTPTRTFSRAGSPEVAKQAIHGLLATLLAIAASAARWRGRHLRQPTKTELGDIAEPLGRIVARHLPTDVIGPDLIDAAAAAGAAHAYVTADRLITRIDTAEDPEWN